jgi:outer membrane protein TolC
LEIIELSTARFNAGLVSELDVARAKAQLAATSSQLPVFETAIRESITALSISPSTLVVKRSF